MTQDQKHSKLHDPKRKKKALSLIKSKTMVMRPQVCSHEGKLVLLYSEPADAFQLITTILQQ